MYTRNVSGLFTRFSNVAFSRVSLVLIISSSLFHSLAYSCSTGERAKRTDCLEEQCLKALAFIVDVIHDNTQPSPCDMKIKHDFAPGLHKRSLIDGSLECQQPERCQRQGVRFLLGSVTDLHSKVSESLSKAVRSVCFLGSMCSKPEITDTSQRLLDNIEIALNETTSFHIAHNIRHPLFLNVSTVPGGNGGDGPDFEGIFG